MSLWPQTVWFPMLRKELVERAARKRTFVVRLLYAVSFFGMFLFIYHSLFERSFMYGPGGIQGLRALGRGDEIYTAILVLQLFGILLFLPAMMCGLITDEKERGTLSLLLLTDISAIEAVLQKYLGGLIPMITLLMLTLPVGGFAYMIGGLTMSAVVYGALLLLIFAATVAAIGLACSSYARTTIGAFMGTYLTLGALYFLPSKPLFPLDLRAITLGETEFLEFAWANAVVTFLALAIACICYQRRANVSPKFYLRRLFKALDRRFKGANQRLGGFELIKDSSNLPEDRPVLWRERQRRQLGKVRYQIRYIVVIVGMATMLALIDIERSPIIMVFAWAIGSIVIVAQASNAIVSDRLTQSLEVLLTTPMAGADIVREKVRALVPLVVVVALPIWVMSLFGAFASRSRRHWDYDASVWLTVLFETVHLVLFLHLFLILGFAVGLKARSRVAAMMKAIGILVFWWLLPGLVIWFLESSRIGAEEFLAYLGPSGVVLGTHLGSEFHQENMGAYLFAITCYITIGIALYIWCLRSADRKLGRPA